MVPDNIDQSKVTINQTDQLDLTLTNNSQSESNITSSEKLDEVRSNSTKPVTVLREDSDDFSFHEPPPLLDDTPIDEQLPTFHKSHSGLDLDDDTEEFAAFGFASAEPADEEFGNFGLSQNRPQSAGLSSPSDQSSSPRLSSPPQRLSSPPPRSSSPPCSSPPPENWGFDDSKTNNKASHEVDWGFIDQDKSSKPAESASKTRRDSAEEADGWAFPEKSVAEPSDGADDDWGFQHFSEVRIILNFS